MSDIVNTTFLWQAQSVFQRFAGLVDKMQYQWDSFISSHLGKESILSYLLRFPVIVVLNLHPEVSVTQRTWSSYPVSADRHWFRFDGTDVGLLVG